MIVVKLDDGFAIASKPYRVSDSKEQSDWFWSGVEWDRGPAGLVKVFSTREEAEAEMKTIFEPPAGGQV